MRRSMLVVAVLPALLLTGCGGPTLDATSEDTLKTSADKIMSGLDAAKKARFEKAMGMLMAKHVLFSGADEATAKANLKKAFDGKTADQVIADGEVAEKEANAEMKKMMTTP